MLAVSKDITERKKVENELKDYREHLEELVWQRTKALEAKNKEMETFTYSVSHDLKAPLRGIDGYSRLLEEDYADKLDGEGRLFLKNVRQSATQMNQLIEDLLAYSRMERRDIQPMEIDLISMIDALIAQRTLDLETRQVEVSVNLPFQTIHSDIATVRQVLTNFFDNAVKFSRDVEMKVSDTGTGIPQDILDSIFEPYFTTKPQGQGTGMGLSMVHGIVQSYGGAIEVVSSPGTGTVFTIYLPISQEAGKSMLYESSKQPRGTERILLVDDEAVVAKVEGKILERQGYKVTVVTDSVECLKLFEEKPASFILHFTIPMMENEFRTRKIKIGQKKL